MVSQAQQSFTAAAAAAAMHASAHYGAGGGGGGSPGGPGGTPLGGSGVGGPGSHHHDIRNFMSSFSDQFGAGKSSIESWKDKSGIFLTSQALVNLIC